MNGLLNGLTEAWEPDPTGGLSGRHLGLDTDTDGALTYEDQAGFPGGKALQVVASGVTLASPTSAFLSAIGQSDCILLFWSLGSSDSDSMLGVAVGEGGANGIDCGAAPPSDSGAVAITAEMPGADNGYQPAVSSDPDTPYTRDLPHMIAAWYTTSDSTLRVQMDGGTVYSIVNTSGVGDPDATNVFAAFLANTVGTLQQGPVYLWQGTAGVANAVSQLSALYSNRLRYADFDDGSGTGAQTFLDTFTGTIGTDLQDHALDSGQSWTYAAFNDAGVFPHVVLDAGHAVSQGDDIHSSGVLVAERGHSGVQTVEIDFTPDMAVFAYLELRARSNNHVADSLDYAAVGYNTSLQKWTLTGDGQDFGLAVDDVLETGVTYRVKLEVTESVVRFYKDGVLMATRDGHYPSTPTGYVGFWFLNATDGQSWVDNFGASIAAGSGGDGGSGASPRWVTVARNRLSVS